MATRISVIIPCKDERPNIAECIDSVKQVADEIIVADSGSTDGTLELVKARGDCRVLQREYVNSADFKNWVIPQATHHWILLLDADERATPELVEEIRRIKQSGELEATAVLAYSIARHNHFLGQRLNYSGWQHDRVRRLFQRSCRYQVRRVHADLDVEESRTAYLKSPFTHHTFRTLKHFLAKQERYAFWGAEDLRDKGRVAGWFNLTLQPVVRFCRQYLLQRGILDGKAGFIVSASAAYSVFVKYAALWEMNHQHAPNTLSITPPNQVSSSPPNQQQRAA